MKALAVRQPWASLIATGKKTLEIRSWRTHYRGALLLCASATPSTDAPNVPPPEHMPLGCTVCVVEVVDCRAVEPGDHAAACFDAPTGFAWVLRLLRRVEPVPVKCRLSFFDVDVPLTTSRIPRRMR